MMEPGLSPAFAYQKPAAHRERLVPILTHLPDGVIPIPPPQLNPAPRKEPPPFFMGRPVHPSYHYKRNRRYAGDESVPYPLPCDQQEVNRQNLVHHIFHEVFGTIHAAEFPKVEDIPAKVLDVGCGSGLWIASMADEFAARGRMDVHFTGMDIVRNCPDMTGVNFRFVKHNMLNLPLPFAAGEFDYIMVREMTLTYPQDRNSEALLDEYLRILKVGGTLELQCSDHTIRCLSPSSIPPSSRSGAYPMTASTRFNLKSENSYIQDYNRYISYFLSTKQLHPAPCTSVQSTLLMEATRLGNIKNRRYALPLDNPHWEGKPMSTITGSLENRSLTSLTPLAEPRRSTESSKSAPQIPTTATVTTMDADTRRIDSEPKDRKNSTMEMFVSNDAKALRILARQTFTSLVRNLEPVLRQSNKIPQEDWDWWFRDLMINFHQNRGLNGGECIELGAWWGVKKS
ncbi:hypothetical protein H072_2064 [Dactylellina haptotyla CBS 200.50]|uniref:Methyltransferase domain-containing protein n=1 Tax=Dactylellina haptotyla (strain CBS 200.50) TaxID=1284197 RepID=S8ALV1_DACHA|nr:hypothetical protein H072_2064 [Dactylellina haptotyla CBS 200.50]